MPDQIGTRQIIRFATFEVDLQASPDGLAVFSRNVSVDEIYSLEVELP